MAKKILAVPCVVGCFGLSGCYQATVNLVPSGNYYLMGDSNCRRYIEKPSEWGNYVECYNSSGEHTENRKSLTPDQVQYYQMKELQNAQNQMLFWQSYNAGFNATKR